MRGVPNCVLQEPVKKAAETTTRGTLKAAMLQGDPNCPDLVAMSVYDSKPVHFISMSCESIKWIEKKRQVWNQAEREMQDISYL